MAGKKNAFCLDDLWPPKWFFSYSDVATLLMTFFIVLATMVSLNIPLELKKGTTNIAFFSKEELQQLKIMAEKAEKDKAILGKATELKKEDEEMMKDVLKIDVEKLLQLLKDYIDSKHLNEVIAIESDEVRIRIIPKAPFLFTKGKDKLTGRAKEFLDKLAELLKFIPSDIRIEGHTDNIPISTPEFPSNWELSVARANSVMRYFIEVHNIDPKRIRAIGYGEYKPMAPNNTETNRSKNRRVILEITPTTDEIQPQIHLQSSRRIVHNLHRAA